MSDPLGEERIEKGMRLAFGLASAKEGESVLDVVERMSGGSVRIQLPDAEEHESPVVRVPGPDDEDTIRGDPRYQIVGEIARGGVGVVFKGHDRDLGRDVAIKVLRKDLKGSPEIVQRFIEEAQVEGQLQHPGVVPVYGLGVQPDGRPYFAMKLIKGETLASLLKDRAEVSQDRRKLLSIFEKVCETVAYAHARRVLHRDLKPSNVLVGAFGQVQVVDWGFAKVLSRGGNADEERVPRPAPEASVIQTVRSESTGSKSIAGSVMGTPAYMPPEQALGFVNRVDETSDVFSLGAILLEILTGQPPYTGKTSEELLVKAGQCEMEEGLSKLATLGVDETLSDLARKCLAPAQTARPRHAGEVAGAISAYLASLEERAREAELRAAAAHRTRRLTLALAAAVLLAVVAGGAGLWYAERTERDRAARAGDTVAESLEKSGVLLGSARQADVLDLAPWASAVAAAEQAAALAKKVAAPPETRERADAFLAQVRADAAAAKDRAAREEREREMARRLRRARGMHLLSGGDMDANGGFEAAFRDFGVNLSDPEKSATVVAESGRRGELIAGLEDWRRTRGFSDLDPVPVENILNRVDPDETRVKIRLAERSKDLAALKALIPAADSGSLPVETVADLGWALWAAGDPAAALGVLRLWQERAPQDPEAYLALGACLSKQQPPTVARLQEAVAVLSRACALDPEGVSARFYLSIAQGSLSLNDAAIASVREAIAIAPEVKELNNLLVTWLCNRAAASLQAGNNLAAAEDVRAAIALREAWQLHVFLAQVLEKLSDWWGVKTAMERALELNKDLDPSTRESLAWALVRLGRYEEAQKVVDAITAMGHTCFDVPYLESTIAAGVGRLQEALDFLARARNIPNKSGPGILDVMEGRLHLAQGHPDDAVADFRKAVEQTRESPDTHHYLARALRNTGDAEGARQEEQSAAHLQEELLRKVDREKLGALEEFRRWGMFFGRAGGLEEAEAALARAFPDASGPERGAFLAGVAGSLVNVQVRLPDGEACLREALAADPRCAFAWEMMAWLRQYRGDFDGAVEAMKRSGDCLGGQNAIHHQLYQLYMNIGRLENAAAVIDDCPNCRANAEVLRSLKELEDKVPTFLGGEWRPTGEEAGKLSDLLICTGRMAPLARLEREQVEAPRSSTEDEATWTRQRVASLQHGVYGAAALAGDASLSPEETSEWRSLAAAWLTEMAGLLRKGNRPLSLHAPEQDGPEAVGMLLTFRLAPIRDEEAMADAPEADREACRRAWAAFRAYHDTVK